MDRRRRLTIDSLESRNLLSITPLINSPGWVRATATGIGTNSAATSQATLNATTGFYQAGDSGGSGITTDITPPRQNEAARRVFTAKFTGKVVEEAPRLLDQSHQFYVLAPGTSTAFLHGTAQLRYYTPVNHSVTFPDPTNPGGPDITETPTSTTGTISMSDRSTQSGTVILANLNGSPTAVDKLGRPTHFNLTLNGGGGSGGIYASSVGSGTLDIAYHGNRATITVHASIFISGVNDQLDIFQSNSHH